MSPAQFLFHLRALPLAFAVSQTLPAQAPPKPEPPQERKLDNYRPVPVSPATKVIEERSLLPQAGIKSGRTDDLAQELPNGMRLYAFTLSGGEKLKIEMKSERHGKVILRFILPTKPDAMTAQIRKANFSPVSVRSSRIEIQNTTDAPYETVLLVYGQCGYTFKLELDRQARK